VLSGPGQLPRGWSIGIELVLIGTGLMRLIVVLGIEEGIAGRELGLDLGFATIPEGGLMLVISAAAATAAPRLWLLGRWQH